ncbi:hypothetical protein BG262_06300 [Floricoccus penangensis]|uniref:Tyrosine specific protein phosphatases domain-containing protein n=1 Tax=Floricoccus penangensis TaxID=1859475 RepID=A0A9Q5JFP1_9LACT|nr:tyrosine-protein phosphatase [Floricoccus penangensis]OFI46092.1 hypothetical protein BG262_06300 [Floricoccus penangensis]
MTNENSDKNIVNFRDIGGYETKMGKLQEGIFFRSGQLTNLNEKQIGLLKNICKIKTIYDFRSQAEVNKEEDTKIDDILYKHLDVLASIQHGGSASLEGMFSDLDNIDESMYKTYEEIVLSESAQNSYHKFLQDLIEEKYSIVFHCFAGKDRTGWAAYLVLKAAGVSDGDIMKDYLETNVSRKSANDEIINKYKDKLNDQQVAGLKIALTVKAEYLEYAIKIMNEEYGSFENYLSLGLGLPNDYREKFTKLYIEN